MRTQGTVCRTRSRGRSFVGIASSDGQYFSDDAMQNPYTTNDAENIYYSTIDSDFVTTPNPPAAITDITTVLNGIVAYWDGLSYDLSQTWANSISTPTDGAAQTDYDVFRGASSSSGADDPTYDNNGFTFNASQNFSSAHANPATIAGMHKTTGGTSWTLFFKLQTGPSVPTVNALFGTADANGDYGLVVRIDSGGNLKIDQYNGATLNTKSASATIQANTVYDIAISRNASNDTIGFAINSSTFQTITPSGWTSSISNAASYNFKLGSRGNGASKIASGVKIFGIVLADHAWTNAELQTANTFIDTHYTPLVPVASTLPAAPSALIAQGSDTKIYVSSYMPSGNGFAVTDFTTQYKLHTDSSWTTFSHSASTALQCTITGVTNGSVYDIRRASVTSQGTSAWSVIVQATPAAAGTPPYTVSGAYKFTVPINSSGQFQGAAVDITDLSTYDSAFFGRSDGVFYFNSPGGGAGTPNTSYCRAELRFLTNYSLSGSNSHTQKWCVDQMTNDSASFKQAKLVVHQSHSAAATPCKITVHGKTDGTYEVYAVCRPTDNAAVPDVTLPLISNYTLGTQIETKIELTGIAVNVYVAGILTGTTPYTASDMSGGTWYPKGGVYAGDNQFSGNVYKARHFAP